MNMGRKSVYLIVLVITCCLISFERANAIEFDFVKFDVSIYKISWNSMVSSHFEDGTAFEITANVTVYNPNNKTIDIEYGTVPHQPFATDLSLRLKNRIRTEFKCWSAGIFTVMGNLSIKSGETNGSSISYLHVKREGLVTPPDGKYIFWIYMHAYGESMLNSTRTLMQINNGIPTFDYNYPSTKFLSLPKFSFVFPLILIALIFKFKKRKMLN
jgi:hypothetical protein